MIYLLKVSQGPLLPEIFINPNRIISVSEGKKDEMKISYDCGSGHKAEGFINRDSLVRYGLISEPQQDQNKTELLRNEQHIMATGNVLPFN